jgi:hypothetical protein
MRKKILISIALLLSFGVVTNAYAATKFLEPGGDADFAEAGTNGFWKGSAGGATVVTDFVHGTHVKSLKFLSLGGIQTANGTIANAGARFSVYVYINTLPTTYKILTPSV